MYKFLTTDNGVTIDETPIELLAHNLGIPFGVNLLETGKAVLQAIDGNLRRHHYKPLFINEGTGLRYIVESVDELGSDKHVMEIGIVT